MENVLVSEQERKHVPTKYSKTLQLKLVDVEKATREMLKKREEDGLPGIIEVRSIHVDKYKELLKSLTYTKDPKTGIMWGISIGEFPDGNIRWQRIILTDHNVFNLDNDADAKMWCVLRMHPSLEGSPLNLEDPTFRMVDPEINAREDLKRGINISKAIKFANEMKEENLLPFARFLNVRLPAVDTPSQIRATIVNYAVMNPAQFLIHYNDPNRRIIETVRMAVAAGIVQDNREKGLSFQGLFLGYTEQEAVRFLETDTNILTRLMRDVRPQEQEMQAGQTLPKVENEEPVKAKTTAKKE